jgi:uncharacterized membrane protein
METGRLITLILIYVVLVLTPLIIGWYNLNKHENYHGETMYMFIPILFSMVIFVAFLNYEVIIEDMKAQKNCPEYEKIEVYKLKD